MPPTKILLITYLTILYLFLGRIIGWGFLSQTTFWNIIIYDKLHHWQLGIVLIILSVLLLRKNIRLRTYLLAIGSGLIIDESMYALTFINPIFFTHYHPVGILLEATALSIYSALVLRGLFGKTKLP